MLEAVFKHLELKYTGMVNSSACAEPWFIQVMNEITFGVTNSSVRVVTVIEVDNSRLKSIAGAILSNCTARHSKTIGIMLRAATRNS